MSRTTTYAYDLSGNLVTKGMPNGVGEQRAHDGRNRVSTLDNVPVGGGSSYLSAYAYGYDAAGNVMQVVETYPGGSLAGRTITNTYDGVYRLLNEQIATSGVGTVTTAYTYDKGNNRLAQVVTGGSGVGTTNYVIGNGGNGAGANQIISATLPDSSVVGFSYDANGNRTQRAYGGHTDVYSYDYEDRLVGLNYQTGGSGTGMYDYSYDYRTRRVARTEPATGTTQIVFDGGTSIEEFGVSGPDLPGVEYLRGHNYRGGVGGLEYSVRSGSANFNQYDSRGDMVAQTNSSGAITFQTAYEAYGEQTVTSGSTADRQKANTKENDPTALLNEGFRYRDLQTGTFITRDPLGFKAGPNMYTYVRQNPWTKFDPEGLAENTNNPPTTPPPSPPPATSAPTNSPPTKQPSQSTTPSAPAPAAPVPAVDQPAKPVQPDQQSPSGVAPEQSQKTVQQQNAVPLKDDKGNVVTGANGAPALVPSNFDIKKVIGAGQTDQELGWMAEALRIAATAKDLAKFDRGGAWDLQRLSGNFDPRFIDSATILIGMFASSAGIPQKAILNVENQIAKSGKYPQGTPMDPTYTHLPVRNVTNTIIGMKLIESGAISAP